MKVVKKPGVRLFEDAKTGASKLKVLWIDGKSMDVWSLEDEICLGSSPTTAVVEYPK
ncbi:hypothetical protein HanIR_Chr09g0402371 [Helianthus annuus]|nr:hypothetical protein HanIR_Chr09g0402371 [Helianthus annuus]